MPLTQGSRLGPYEIVAPLGAGGMGEVYRARDPRLGRDVAIKILPPAIRADPERLGRFEQEARATAALNHPNILAVYDVGTEATTTYVVSELLDGESLRSVLTESGALPLRKAIDYGIQIANGIAAAHDKGIVHRDLKPENLFITTDGRAKILDFGLAKLVEPAGPAKARPTPGSTLPTTPAPTEPGVVLGTVGYMSPEQVRGRLVDHRSDIFSFGVVIYEMLSGHRAFLADSPAETMAAIAKNEPAELSTAERPVAPAIERIISRCLEKTPDARFQSAKDLAFALEAVSSPTQPAVAVPSRPFAFGRERLVWSLAGGLALVAAAAVVVSMTRTPPVDQRVLRYTLPWPEKVTLPPAPNFESGTLSPDGRRLAFLARGSTGNTIWVRELDGAAPHQLSGTGPVQNLFWSPDSRFIGFIAGGAHAVRKIDPSGGPAYTLAEFPDLVSGGSWNQFGDIIVGTTAGPILRVSESDGKVTTITQKDPQKNELAHRWPHFLPDGKHFLFYAYGPSEIVVASLDGSERRTIVHADSKAIYSPPGYLLYVRQDSLLKHPFNADTLTLTGEPVAIAEGVLNSTFTATASFTASGNGVLAWLAGGSASTDRLVWVDRHGQPRSTIGEPGDYRNPRLSPDGKRLAVERMGSGSPEVWILDVSRGTSAPSMKLTNAPLSGQQAAWSPDGLRVAFAVGQPGPATLYQKAASGLGSEEVLVKSELGAGPSDWTPDGRVLYHQGVGQPPTSLMLLDRDGKTRPVVESRFIAIDGRFSPDGKWLAYVSTESGRPQVYLQNFPEATTKMPVSGDGGIQPVWRRDGKELFYLGPDGTLTAVPVKLGATADIGAAQPLFQTNIVGGGFSIGGGIHHQYDVSVDGQQFLILTAGDRTETPFNVIVNWPAAAHR